MLTQTTTSLLSSLIGLIGSVVILFTLSPTLLLVALLLAPGPARGRDHLRPAAPARVRPQVQDSIAHSTATAEEALGGIRVVKSYVREDYENERYGGDLAGVVASGSRLALWRALFGALMGFLGFGAIAVLLWYTGHEVIDGRAVDRHADRVPALRRHDRGEPRDDRRPVRAAPRGDRARCSGCSRSSTPSRPIVDAPDAVDLGPVTGRIELDGRLVRVRRRPARPARPRPARAGRARCSRSSGRPGRARRRSSGLIPRLWDVSRGDDPRRRHATCAT